jgi:hypothetical protein
MTCTNPDIGDMCRLTEENANLRAALATALRERDALRAVLLEYIEVDMGTGIRPRAAALLDEIAARVGKP